MSRAMLSPGSLPLLPHDLFHTQIIPAMLSEHLHDLLVEPDALTWHAFYILPQVSVAFHDTCQSLCAIIFGLEGEEGGAVIEEILTFVQSLWTRARRPPDRTRPLPEYTYAELMSSKTLIRVYACAALAQSFLKLDVLSHIILGDGAPAVPDNEHDDTDSQYTWGVVDATAGSWKSRMRDDEMHRVYLPLTCAMKLCDYIRPQRLAYSAADYLADIVPVYSTAPVMLKYAQDLETYIIREHRVELETWVNWTRQTLRLIRDTEHLLAQMQSMGRLVESFKRDSSIPFDVLNATNIINVMRGVALADWGPHSDEIRGHAATLLLAWTLSP